jgi:hypothetical protein
MTSTAPSHASVTTQVYRVFIKATPRAIWDAITTPEWTQRYGSARATCMSSVLAAHIAATPTHACDGHAGCHGGNESRTGATCAPARTGCWISWLTRLPGLRLETTSRGTSATATAHPKP